MNLYIIRRRPRSYVADAFDFAIVAAETGADARHTHPPRASFGPTTPGPREARTTASNSGFTPTRSAHVCSTSPPKAHAPARSAPHSTISKPKLPDRVFGRLGGKLILQPNSEKEWAEFENEIAGLMINGPISNEVLTEGEDR